MKKTIAIIAPFIDSSQFNLDYCLRLKQNDRELTLAAFYEWAAEGFRTDRISRGIDYGKDIPSAGYYLQGLLHHHGYDTILTNKYDDKSLELLAGKDLFAVCVSTTMIITTGSLLSLFSAIKRNIPGIPVIAGNLPEVRNIIEENDCGVIVPVITSEEISNTLKRLRDDKDYLNKLRTNSVIASKKLNWENESKKVTDFYKDVINAR